MSGVLTGPGLDDYALPDEVRDDILSPALLVFPAHVRHNVASMIDACSGDPNRWRPHLKTTKMPEVWRDLLDAGIRQFKCATTREAMLLLSLLDEAGVEGGEGGDLLIAYPLIGPALKRAGELAAAHPGARVSVLAEDPALVDSISATLGVFVDVNPDMNRSGVPLADRRRVLEIATRAGERFRGVHFYDGHVRGSDAEARRVQCHRLYDELLAIRETLIAAGMPPRELITSGTLSFEAALAYESLADLSDAIHRISPGTVVFHDLGTMEKNLATDLRPAAVLMTRVVSRPAADIITCDSGSKSIAAELGDPCALVIGQPHLTPLTPSEEHLPMRVDTTQGNAPALGDILLLVPRHVCPTVNLAEQAVFIEDGMVTGIVDVAGRGHELIVSPRRI